MSGQVWNYSFTVPCALLLVILLVVYFGQWRAYKASLPDTTARAGSRGSRRQGKRAEARERA